jgi:hypothetical protein
MRFMFMVKAGADYEAGRPPPPELIAAMRGLTEEMMKTGKLLEMGGLLPSAWGARVRVGRGQLAVTDGPFTETKELVGGYAIFRVDSKAEALELGKRFMKLHQDALGPSYEGELEIRQMVEAGDQCGTVKSESEQLATT